MNSMNIEHCTSAINNINNVLTLMAGNISSLEETSDGISKSWSSDNSTAFTTKVNGIIEKMNELKSNISSINAAVNKTKEQIESVDATVNG